MLTISQQLWAASLEESDGSNHLISAARLHSRAELMILSFHLILSIALREAHENIPKGNQLKDTSFICNLSPALSSTPPQSL